MKGSVSFTGICLRQNAKRKLAFKTVFRYTGAMHWWLLLTLLLSNLVSAQGTYGLGEAGLQSTPRLLVGSWGNRQQCNAAHSESFTTPNLHPIEISEQWLKQGHIYCQVFWFDPRGDASGFSVNGFAQCGEDGIREYRLRFTLEDDLLNIYWTPDYQSTGLLRCLQQ